MLLITTCHCNRKLGVPRAMNDEFRAAFPGRGKPASSSIGTVNCGTEFA